MSAVNGLSEVYEGFQDALEQLRRTGRREGVELTAIPAPTHLAPFAAAVRAEVRTPPVRLRGALLPAGPAARPTGTPSAAALGLPAGTAGDELATGRFVLLHDPSEPAAWGGAFRIVTWARAAADREIGCDDTAGTIAWTWLLEALERHRAGYSREGGTASRVLAEGFGLLGDQEEGADVELRASWTPEGSDVAPHLAAWADTVCTFAGLPPYPPGVTVLHPRR
ncbi:enoyl-CoA hydratase [Kocuria rosea subsp. polaris]|uniref:Enoyl-CoA hydratase n=1 Tax=Kocuria rosea subsp. polaris TaxID=136273 RepID=A0A0W8ILJ0_KOCRO|nr:DUF3000 family protein [Kocuria polaris]KUG60894.1 enoyl-CoA hydratase [Kocuria polaris]